MTITITAAMVPIMPLFIYSLLNRNGLNLRAIKGDDFRQVRCDARHFVGLPCRMVQADTPVMAEFEENAAGPFCHGVTPLPSGEVGAKRRMRGFGLSGDPNPSP